MKKTVSIIIAACAIAASCSGPAPEREVNWTAQWIGAPWEGEQCVKGEDLHAPELATTFIAEKRVRSATAYVTGLGFFELYINGSRVGDDVLSPNETSYGHRETLKNFFISMDDSAWRSFRVPYLTYDVTPMLKKGENSVSAFLGGGMYSTGTRRWTEPYGTPRFICQIEVEYSDGTRATLASGPEWQARRSPIVKNDMYEGEIYDARLEKSEVWEPVALRQAPDGRLVPQEGPSDKVMETLRPVSIVKMDDGRWEVDFGDYITGWVRLKDFVAPEGAAIEVEFPIESEGNGTYRYVGAGLRVESYAPRFCWWTFEKAVVSGWKGELTADNIVAEAVYSDVPENAVFDCSNPMLVRINDIWKRTQKDNMHLAVPTDCPHREKGPYTGDGEVACVAVMHNFDADAFYRKWIHDILDCQDTLSGYVPNGAPWHPGCGGGVPWGSAVCIVPWEHYVHYGDSGVLAESYDAMKLYLKWMQSWRLEDGTMLQQMTAPGGMPNYWLNLGEWCPPYGLASERLVHTWYLWRCASITAKTASALGLSAEASLYADLADDVASAFHKAFYNPETCSYGAGSGITDDSGYGTGGASGYGDGSNIFALAMGVPADVHDDVVRTVLSELEANGGHLNTGIYGTSLFFETLCREGLADKAYEAMTKTDYPGFGWWLEQGAKTTWEQWDGSASRNHPMFGGGLTWMYRWLCGVQTDEAEPGYRHIILRPTPAGDLTRASYGTATPYGKLSVSWEMPDGTLDSFRIKVTIPRGTSATLYLPDGSDPLTLRPGKHTFIL